jgi:signal peptide peptidase SppA
MTALGNDPQIGMVVLLIDSPGGVVTGVQEAADAIYAARQNKPVVAIVNPLCASAAYWLAAQASEIISVPSGDVGSVGVFILHAECSKMMEDAGVKPTFIFAKDSPYKVDGNAYEPLSDTARDEFQTGVDEVMADFVKAIARGRGVPASKVIADFGKGRTMDAKRAKAAGMIDRVATVNVALARLGLSPASMDDDESRRGRRGEQVESVTFSKRADARGAVRLYVDRDWPQRIAVTQDLLNDSGDEFATDGDDVLFTASNGSARYRMDHIDDTGCWVCDLICGEYEPAPVGYAAKAPEMHLGDLGEADAADAQPEVARLAAARRRSLFILEHS